MRAIIKPTAYIAWLPMGNITVKPADAYVSWLPLGTLSVTPEVCASWVPMGEIHIKPVLCASIVPGSQKTNADTSRKVSKPLSAAGDTLRRIGRPCSPMADMARKVCRRETFGGDTIRSIAVSETVSADTGRRTYLPSGAIVAPQRVYLVDSHREDLRQANNGIHLVAAVGNDIPPSANRCQYRPSFGVASDRHG